MRAKAAGCPARTATTYWRQFWRFAGRASDSPKLLESAWTSQTLPELPRNSSATSPWILRAIPRKFPRPFQRLHCFAPSDKRAEILRLLGKTRKNQTSSLISKEKVNKVGWKRRASFQNVLRIDA